MQPFDQAFTLPSQSQTGNLHIRGGEEHSAHLSQEARPQELLPPLRVHECGRHNRPKNVGRAHQRTRRDVRGHAGLPEHGGAEVDDGVDARELLEHEKGARDERHCRKGAMCDSRHAQTRVQSNVTGTEKDSSLRSFPWQTEMFMPGLFYESLHGMTPAQKQGYPFPFDKRNRISGTE